MPPFRRPNPLRNPIPQTGEGGGGADAASGRPLSGRAVLFLLLGFFGIVIAANGILMALAIGTMPGLETEKPYQAGIDYNAEIAAARAQASRGWKVASRVVRDPSGRAAVTVNARDANGAPLPGLVVMVRLIRPTDQRADRLAMLNERETGRYVGDAADVAEGLWDIEIEAGRGDARLYRSKNRITLR
jgi:nitrogen fixation protein FixH